jgi:hypothetical protein
MRESKGGVSIFLKTFRLIYLGLVAYSNLYLEMALWTHCREYLVVILRIVVLAFLAISERALSQS